MPWTLHLAHALTPQLLSLNSLVAQGGGAIWIKIKYPAPIIIFLFCMYIDFFGRGVKLYWWNLLNIFHIMVYIFMSCTYLSDHSFSPRVGRVGAKWFLSDLVQCVNTGYPILSYLWLWLHNNVIKMFSVEI